MLQDAATIRRPPGKPFPAPALPFPAGITFFWLNSSKVAIKVLYWRKLKLMPTDTNKKEWNKGTTSVRIDDKIHRKLKIKAAKEGKTIKQLIEEKFTEETGNQ